MKELLGSVVLVAGACGDVASPEGGTTGRATETTGPAGTGTGTATSVGPTSVTSESDTTSTSTASGSGSESGSESGGGSSTGGGPPEFDIGNCVPGDPDIYDPLCGDGKLDPGEECDPGAETADCDLDCTDSMCGDGIVNFAAGEECDDGNDDASDLCDACMQPPSGLELTPSTFSNETINFGSSVHPDVAVTVLDDVEHFMIAYPVHEGAVGPGPGELLLEVRSRTGDLVVAPAQIAAGDHLGVSLDNNCSAVGVAAWRTGAGAMRSVQYRVIDPGGTPSASGVVDLPDSDHTVWEGASSPVVAAGADGGFCIQWRSGDGGPTTYFARCLDSLGDDLGAGTFEVGRVPMDAFEVLNVHTLIAMGDGYLSLTSDVEAVGQLLDASGEPVGEPFDVSDDGAFMPGSAFELPGGDFLTAYVGGGLRTRRFSAAGVAQAASNDVGAAYVDAFVLGLEDRVATIAGANFNMTRVDADGVVVAPPISFTAGNEDLYPSAATTSRGDVMVVWHPALGNPLWGSTRVQLFPRFLAP